MQVCPASGKVSHETQNGARKQARSARYGGQGSRWTSVGTYLCNHCERWHVGHKRNIRARA